MGGQSGVGGAALNLDVWKACLGRITSSKYWIIQSEYDHLCCIAHITYIFLHIFFVDSWNKSLTASTSTSVFFLYGIR